MSSDHLDLLNDNLCKMIEFSACFLSAGHPIWRELLLQEHEHYCEFCLSFWCYYCLLPKLSSDSFVLIYTSPLGPFTAVSWGFCTSSGLFSENDSGFAISRCSNSLRSFPKVHCWSYFDLHPSIICVFNSLLDFAPLSQTYEILLFCSVFASCDRIISHATFFEGVKYEVSAIFLSRSHSLKEII